MSADDSDHSSDPVLEIAAGVLLAVLSVALLFWVIPANVGHSTSEHDMSPDLFPKLAAWCLLGLSLSLVVNRLVKTRRAKTADILRGIADSGGTSTSISNGTTNGGRAILLQAFVWLVVGVLAYVGMARLSFLATASALILVGALACHYRNGWILAALALSLPFALVQVAWFFFEVKLP